MLQKPFERLFGTVSSGAEYVSKDRVVGWQTTGTNGIIEIWNNGYSGVFANAGKCHAELNADQVSALYQDIDTIPGMLLYWALAHRGRAGVDVMDLRIGPPNATVLQRQMSDGNTAWTRYNGSYIVPAGQFITRFSFGANSSAGGNPTVGNFLDSIAFTTPAVACPTRVTAINTNPPPTSSLPVLTTSLGLCVVLLLFCVCLLTSFIASQKHNHRRHYAAAQQRHRHGGQQQDHLAVHAKRGLRWR